MFRPVTRFGVLRKVAFQVQRNLGVSSVLAQKSGTALDPIQQLFLEKIREYKSKSVEGKLVGATPEVEKALKEELDKVDRMFNATGKDMTKFPTFAFTDPQLEPVGLGETKDLEQVDEIQEAVEEEEDNQPYFQVE